MLISVIVPVYNSEDTIEMCLRSIINQTFSDYEIVVVNDGSSDRSLDVIRRISMVDSRIRYVSQENQGRSVARWNGVKLSHGEWICFVDSDDTLPEYSLQLLSNGISSKTDIVMGNANSIGFFTNTLISISDFRHLAVRAEGTIGVPWGSLYRKNVISYSMFDVPRFLIMGEDYIFWLRLIFNTDKDVSLVAQNAYSKGDDHTCNNFIWTTEYISLLNDYRIASIPVEMFDVYLADTVYDRIENIIAVAKYENRNIWSESSFYSSLLSDMKNCSVSFTFRQQFYLSLPSLFLRKLYSKISNTIQKFRS